MNADSHKSNLFNESGCLSPQALSQYVNSNLMDDELIVVEAHLSSCPLCKDAVEGSQLFSMEVASMDNMSERLNLRLRKRFDYYPANKKAAVRSPGLRSFIIPAAASIIILISIISYFHLLFPDNNELAQLDEEEVLFTEQDKAATIGGVFNKEAEEKGIPAPSRGKKEAELPQKEVVVSIKEETGAGAEEVSNIEEDIMLAEPDQEDAPVVSRAKAGKKASVETSEMIVVYDKDPSFPGGEDSLYVFLAKHMKYNVVTEKAADTSILVQFIVSRKGRSKDFNFIRGAGDEVNTEILRVLKMMPDWIPAVKEGENVEEIVVLPIHLTLK